MEIPKGYKQTEVGIIPEDWDVKTLGSLGNFSKGMGIKKNEANTGDLPCIRYGELYTHYNDVIREFSSYINSSIAKKSKRLRKNSILFAGSGETKEEIGKCVAFIGDVEVFAGGDIVILELVGSVPIFLGYLLNAPIISRQKASNGQGDAVVHISSKALSTIKIPYPKKEEQTAIATTLSDVDTLISSLTTLIQKKRQIKTATMQPLLTGKQRLPGFGEGKGMQQTELGEIPEDWEVIEIGRIASVKTGPFGSTLHEEDYVSDGTPIITVEHLGEQGVTYQNLPMVSDSDRKRLSAYQLKVGDIAFSRVGSVDRNALITEKEGGWLFSGRLLRVRPDTNHYSPAYLSYHFHSEPFKKRVRDIAVGQTMPSLNTGLLKKVKVSAPNDMEEQDAIAEALSKMDEEIITLESRLTKAKAIKQGMMQELLTGKTRLIQPQSQPDQGE